MYTQIIDKYIPEWYAVSEKGGRFMQYTRNISLVLAVVLLLSLFGGCNGVPNETDFPVTTATLETTAAPATAVAPEATVETTAPISETTAPAVTNAITVYVSDGYLRMPIDLETGSGSITLDDSVVKNMDTQHSVSLHLEPGEYWIRTTLYLKDLRLSVNGEMLETPCDVEYVGATGMCCYIYTFTGDRLPVSEIIELSCSFSEAKNREERWEENVASFLPPEAKGVLAKERIMFTTESTRMVVYDPIGKGPCVYTTTTNGEIFKDAQFEKLLADKEYTASHYLGGQSGLTDEYALYFMLENNGQYDYVVFYNMYQRSTTDFSCSRMFMSDILEYDPNAPFPNTSYPQTADTVDELRIFGDAQKDKRLQFVAALLEGDTEAVKTMLGTIKERGKDAPYLTAEQLLNCVQEKRIIVYLTTLYSDAEEKLYIVTDGRNYYALEADAQTGLVNIEYRDY